MVPFSRPYPHTPPIVDGHQVRSKQRGVKFGRRIVDSRLVQVPFPPAIAFRPIERLGGETGWHHGNRLWGIRGLLDLLFGGAGMWRVEEIRRDRLLRLQAEMRLPRRAWLQFEAEPEGGGSIVRQTAIFDPIGVLGQLY